MENQCVCVRERVYGLRNSESKEREGERERDRESGRIKQILAGRDGQSVVFSSIFTVVTSVVFVSLWWTDAQSLCLLFSLWFLGC